VETCCSTSLNRRSLKPANQSGLSLAKMMIRSFVCDRGGNIAITFALALIPIMGMTGAAVDYGRLTARTAQLHSIADGAALHAAKALSATYGQADATRQSTAEQAANSYVAQQAPSAQRTTTVFLSEKAVQVTLSESLNLVFSGLLGQDTSSVRVRSKATYSTLAGCITALNQAAVPGIDVQGSATITGANCSIWSNATNSSSSITVQGRMRGLKVCAAGGGSGDISPPLQRFCEPAENPFAGRQLSASTGCTYSNTVITSNTTILPGVYCGGLEIRGASVTFSPGLYTIRTGAFALQGNAAVTGAGVSVLLGSGAYLDFQGNPSINLSAMTTGPLAGLVIASDPSAPAQTSTMSGNVEAFLRTAISGSIYLPNHRLSLSGNSDLALNGPADRLVVGSISVSGNSSITSAANQSSNLSVRLSE
jgi:Flp pilus assembly protein TadG